MKKINIKYLLIIVVFVAVAIFVLRPQIVLVENTVSLSKEEFPELTHEQKVELDDVFWGNDKENFYKVVFVNDGDTVIIDMEGERIPVRLIGIDTPEVNTKYTKEECFGKEASKNTFELLFGKEISLELDETQGGFDKYNRLLAYIILDGENINGRLIKEGFAKEYTYKENPYKYQKEFLSYELEAKENNIGMWEEDVCNE